MVRVRAAAIVLRETIRRPGRALPLPLPRRDRHQDSPASDGGPLHRRLRPWSQGRPVGPRRIFPALVSPRFSRGETLFARRAPPAWDNTISGTLPFPDDFLLG